MAKKITGYVKLQIPAGKATPAPPVGPALGQAGVGAIYLGNVSTEFAVKDAANTQQGQVRSSGMFLRENGMAGVIQQIDLAV